MSHSMTQNSQNSAAFYEAEIYSQFMLENLNDGFLPTQFYRNVSDFAKGTTLNIKTIGTVALQEVAEGTPLIYNPIDTGSVTLSISDYAGDAWAISDILRQDGSNIEQLMASRAMESTRAFQVDAESRFLKQCAQVTSVAGSDAERSNTINGFAHAFPASGANTTLVLADIIAMGLAFDKANVPAQGRVMIVDPIVAATMQLFFTATTSFQSNSSPKFTSMLESSFVNEGRFVTNLYGFDIYTSNRLHVLEAAVSLAGTDAAIGQVANIAMCVADDNCKPLMYASRQAPSAETSRNKDLRQDEFIVTARDGFGIQRNDTIGVIYTSATATS
ncbi:MAG: hypothetical protein HRU12_22890 [Phaeodactylibacter sp.]|nr:hypothetical protein [Phaeodactylibacter sp.]